MIWTPEGYKEKISPLEESSLKKKRRMVKWYQRKVQLPQVRIEMVEVAEKEANDTCQMANGIISGTNYLGQM